MLNEANEYLFAHKDDDQQGPPSSGNGTEETGAPKVEGTNKGTLAIDVACVPVNIRYPQDVFLLNGAREKVEYMICRMCKTYGLQLSRRYRRKARKDYLYSCRIFSRFRNGYFCVCFDNTSGMCYMVEATA